MTVFAILMPSPQPKLAEKIKSVFPKDHLAINDTQWLISATGTVTELSAKLGIYDAARSNHSRNGSSDNLRDICILWSSACHGMGLGQGKAGGSSKCLKVAKIRNRRDKSRA